ncbi:unnamed protein product [Caenorhabditis auriculariae]|uniref:Uncharacterized protein n=1 Tax=Caenorhabditis auriculariae TaxID=2777116 RepID=A0A8S1HT04_9PELO|nr:unnamed protein product [Caenorhabditis auriculariae]
MKTRRSRFRNAAARNCRLVDPQSRRIFAKILLGESIVFLHNCVNGDNDLIDELKLGPDSARLWRKPAARCIVAAWATSAAQTWFSLPTHMRCKAGKEVRAAGRSSAQKKMRHFQHVRAQGGRNRQKTREVTGTAQLTSIDQKDDHVAGISCRARIPQLHCDLLNHLTNNSRI